MYGDPMGLGVSYERGTLVPVMKRGPNPLNHRNEFSRLLNSLSQVAVYLPSYRIAHL